MKKHLVVIGAHPLDAEQLGGAIASRLQEDGVETLMVHVTDGGGHYPPMGRDASAKEALAEAEAASRVLGVPQHWCGWDSRDLFAGGKYRAELAERLREWDPDVVITHWRGSWHPRHTCTARLVANALKTAGLSPAVYYGENFEELKGFVPKCYVDISDHVEPWWKAMECYSLHRASQDIKPGDHQTFPYHSYYRALPRVRGLEVGLPLAQGLATGAPGPRKVVAINELAGGKR